MTDTGYVRLLGLTKRYGDVLAVRGVSVDIAKGSFFSLLGPSGCGKTTSLRIVAGFVYPTSGSVWVNGANVTNLPPERRNTGIVFQNYAIFPHMTVFDNVAFGLRMRKRSKATIGSEVRSALKQVGLDGYEGRYRRELSGGQQQRIALARVLVTQPDVLLLDEPLSALDKNLREEMKLWVRSLQRRLGITTIYVTHDQTEALTMSDQVAVMKDGLIRQVAPPQEIYEHPTDLYVATFIGESNVVQSTVAGVHDDSIEVDVFGQRLSVQRPAFAVSIGQQVSMVVRPEQVTVTHASDLSSGQAGVTGSVIERVYEGARVRFRIRIDNSDVLFAAEVPNVRTGQGYEVGDPVRINWDRKAAPVLERPAESASLGVSDEREASSRGRKRVSPTYETDQSVVR